MNSVRKLLISGTILLASAFLFSTCKKIAPKEPVDESPVFYASGMINSSPILLEAGKGDYFMETGYELDINVFQFNAYLKRVCSGCNESLNIKIRSDRETSDPNGLFIDSAFNKGNYVFYNAIGASPAYQVQFANFSSGTGVASHLWAFGDGTFSTDPNPLKKYDVGGKYTVTYTATYPGGCVSDLNYDVEVKTAHDAGFSVTPKDTSAFQFTVGIYGMVSVWDYGDGNTGSGDTVNHTYAVPGKYKVCLVQYNGPDTLRECQNIASSSIATCLANFHYTSNQVIGTDTLHLSEVIVEWKDVNGTLYSSTKALQGPGTYFKILSSSPWLRNSKGEQTRKFDFETTCNLSDGVQQIRFTGVHGTMAVAIP